MHEQKINHHSRLAMRFDGSSPSKPAWRTGTSRSDEGRLAPQPELAAEQRERHLSGHMTDMNTQCGPKAQNRKQERLGR